MITRTQGTVFFTGIFFLSLLWFNGIKFFQTDPAKKGTQVTFTFTLPSLSEQLNTKELDRFFLESTRWASLSGSNSLFSPKVLTPDTFEKTLAFLPGKGKDNPMSDFRQFDHNQKRSDSTPPDLFKIISRAYRKKRADFGDENLPSDTYWEEI